MQFSITVIASIVEVTVELNRYDSAHITPLYVRAGDLAHACVDAFCFATGLALTVNIAVCILPDGTLMHLLLKNAELAEHCTLFNMPMLTAQDRVHFGKTLEALFSEPALFIALNELIQANLLPHQAITNCARALDGLESS